MGWASGSDIAREMIIAIKHLVPSHGTRSALYLNLIEALEGHDWDTQDEAMGIDPLFDKAMYFIHPDWSENE